ncbi:MAG TPA: amidohydrolase family protein [Nitrospirota bacterium]|nr:amidohydrolase family protein [Nitrospirota bacterium]
MILLSSILLTLAHDAAPVVNGAIVVRDGVITEHGTASRILKRHPHQKTYRLENAVLMPGLVNAHAHLELPPLLETIRAETFPAWVQNLIRVKRLIGISRYEAAARKNIETLADSGTTTVGEICTHNVSPRLLKESGLRCIIYSEVIGMSPSASAARISCPPSRPASLVQYGISPHSPYTVSRTLLQRIKTISTRRNLRLAMHVAESADEAGLLQRKKSGLKNLYQAVGWDLDWAPVAASPLAYLRDQGVLGPDFLAVHAVQISASDIDILRRSRTPVAHCPRSNHETGVGRMPLRKMLDAGVPVGLGTDSLASSPSLSMWDEMRYALKAHGRSGVSAEDILRLATEGGAKALGLGREIGTIERGKRADIIAVPLPSRNTGNLYPDLLRETKTCIMSVVNGKVLFR